MSLVCVLHLWMSEWVGDSSPQDRKCKRNPGFWGKIMFYFARVQVKVTNGIATVETFTLKLNICV